ncbi:hypothetical protein KC332_g741 [Hortaea werneckii]|nr:hypothetical protein KC358_g14172 [Hortaea werneckii]KAI6852383.1 hypothetical protein KC350_g919 [Hortaea werneckii]KAI6924677.1 hypothetical protein KC341_g13883 [Hortaea werneckii]KAI6950287.1 hypothetical protein KC348_g800 [Hortaea werneckii]KAI6958350.1 hypothetical protein KC321_g14049 [Hortaea werneckii]
MANNKERPSPQQHCAKDPDEPPGFSQSRSRTPKERAARVGYLRRRVFTTVELFEGVLNQLPSVASQLHAIEAVGVHLKSTKVHELKLLESFCNFVSYRYDHHAIVPESMGLTFRECFLHLDAFGVWSATDEEIKSKCLPYIMQTTVPRDTIWSETHVPLDRSAICIDAERMRVLMDRVPFIEWAGGRKTIYLYLTLCEEEQFRGYSDSEWETLSELGRARLEFPDGIAALPKILIEDTREMINEQVDNLHDSSINMPWCEWLDLIWDPDDLLPPILLSGRPYRSIKDSHRLSSVTYMRLWIHAYATREWADIMMHEWVVGSKFQNMVGSNCSVHLLVARTESDVDPLPAWAVDAFHLSGRFFIHQGRWPEEIWHKGRFFSSGKLAIMDGAWE